jgi:hypothetical protein
VRGEVFTAVKIQVDFFWVVTQCSDVLGYQLFSGQCCLHLHYSEAGGSMVLRNFVIVPEYYTALQPGRTRMNKQP